MNSMFFPHLGNAIIFWTVSLKNIKWFPQITISLKITLATAKWSHWRTKIWWLIMGGRWIRRQTLINFWPYYQKRLCRGLRKKVCFIVNFAYCFEKGYPASPSTLVSFVKNFLPLNLYWFVPLGVFFEFFYFCNVSTFSPFSPKKLVLLTFYLCFYEKMLE